MTSENAAVVRAMFGQGWSAEEIAETLRVDAAEVASIAAEPVRAPAARPPRLSPGEQARAATRALAGMMRRERPVGSPPPRGETVMQPGANVYGKR